MNREQRLSAFLIKRFLIALLVVSLVEYGLLTLMRQTVLPFVFTAFFGEYGDYFIGGITLRLLFVIFLDALIRILPGVMPEVSREPFLWLANALERWFLAADAENPIYTLPWQQKLTFYIILAAVLLILLVPYVLGAVNFSKLVIREFRAIGDERRMVHEEYAKRRNLMLADIAHDLRTPITTVAGYSKALADGMVDEAHTREYLDAIQRKSAQMNELIDLLFHYVKLDSEGFVLNRQKEDICEMVRECGAALYTDVEHAGMTLNAEIPEEPYVVWADKVQLSRVIDNLLVNAVRYNQAGSEIGLVVCRDDDRIRIYVADQGIKIPDEQAMHLFEPFYRADASRSSCGGSGLGLSVAQKVAKMHGFELVLVQQPELNHHPMMQGYTKAFVLTAHAEE